MIDSRHRAALAILRRALIFASGLAEARGGRGGGFGSRGMRTFNPPPVTRTAPRPAQPIERSATQPGQAGAQQPGAARNPGIGQGVPRAGGFFNRPGFMGGLFGGLLGAGLIGMLFGSGFLGGLSGLGSILGLALQLALVFFLVRWAMRAFMRRSEPALAGGSGMAGNSAALSRVNFPNAPASGASANPRRDISSMLTGAPRRPGSTSPVAGADELGITQVDLDQFESLLVNIQEAYSNEDAASLRA
jgi:predicted lipid-binding transport protein (Tim44 family)